MNKYIWQTPNWFDFKYNSKILIEPLSRARNAQGKLLGKISSLNIGQETEAQAEVLVEEALRTAEIEGMALNRVAVRSSVAVRLGLPHGLSIKDRNADSLVEVLLDAIRNNDKPLTSGRLNGWQAALFPTGYSGLRKIKTGTLRGVEPMKVVSGPVGKEKIHFEAPPKEQAKKELQLFIDWWNNSLGSMDGVLRAATAHLRFITIHPFEDGNGRIARALTDMALAQDEKLKVRFYSISSQIMKNREEYYDMLENVQNCRVDSTKWFLWFLKCVTLAIEHSEDVTTNVFKRAEFWKKHTQTYLNEKQKKVITKMLEAGPEGFAEGLTTRKYVAMTKTSRATAFREIAYLVEKGILHHSAGKGRSVKYDLIC
ncbi:MAG: cell filamentation protein Fic [Elusimicrobia bacterium RIFOXYA2_FULL_40_6]|nr:MAG: cell filamentation protein Fic [Elusimicrobia bacterium RIFOXYA2_FULL_40_6]